MRRVLALGVAGAVAIGASSWWVAAVPVTFRQDRPGVVEWFPLGGAVPRVAYYAGLGALIFSWLMVGRRLLLGERIPSAQIGRYAICCALPLLLALPFGRDMWAYAAQGNLFHHGLDPYAHGPADLPGAYSDEVSLVWRRSTTPYGPLWMLLSRAAVPASGEHVLLTALLLRLPAFAGLLLWIRALPKLAANVGARADVALWLGAACPLTVVLGIGGGHNDLLMAGLMVAGVALASRGGPLPELALAGAVVGLAVAVKSPAAVALAFTVPLWLHARHFPMTARRVLVAGAVALSGALVAFAVITAVSGLGLGWTRQASTDVTVVSWLSLPTALAMLSKVVTGTLDGATAVDGTMRAIRAVGEAVAAATVAALWWMAFRRAPLAWLTIALAAVAVLVPAVQPWYFCWALAFAGLVVARRSALLALATLVVAAVVLVRPNGQGLEMKPAALPIIAGSLFVCWLALRAVPGRSAPDDDRTEHARAEVRADDGT